MMIFVGLLVAIPSALVGLLFSVLVDRAMPVPMRSLGPGSEKHQPLPLEELPSLWLSLLPVLLPLVLIGTGTLATTLADREDRARLSVADIRDFNALRSTLRSAADADQPSPGRAVMEHPALAPEARQLILREEALQPSQQSEVVAALNEVLLSRDLYREEAFADVDISPQTEEMLESVNLRTKPVDRRRMNRLLLEESFPQLIAPHVWESPARRWANRTALWSNANFALLLAALVAIWTLKSVRRLSLRDTANEVEESLMSGGVIILITAAGGAFGAMLNDAQIGDSIQAVFRESTAGGVGLLLLAYTISAVLKIAQGSSTVAMIVASGMVGAIASGVTTGYHPVYLGTAVGAGALFGSWMNDSGFWVFAKMGGLTEAEALKSWTLLLLVLSIAGLVTTLVLSQLLPLSGA
jgi:H+/gluconate symporter-like permease